MSSAWLTTGDTVPVVFRCIQMADGSHRWLRYPRVGMNGAHAFGSPKGLSLIVFFLTSSLIFSQLAHAREKLYASQRSGACRLLQAGSRGIPESCLICTGVSAKRSSCSPFLKAHATLTLALSQSNCCGP